LGVCTHVIQEWEIAFDQAIYALGSHVDVDLKLAGKSDFGMTFKRSKFSRRHTACSNSMQTQSDYPFGSAVWR